MSAFFRIAKFYSPMLTFIVILLCSTFLFADDSIQTYKINDELSIREIEKGIYIVTHDFPWPANSMLVEMANNEFVFVDTPYTPSATEEVLDWIYSKFGNRNIVEINTGFHFDNLGGNSALIKRGISVYGSFETVQLIKERGESSRALMLKWLQSPEYGRYYNVYTTLEYTPPNKLFHLKDGLTLSFGEEDVKVLFPGPTHADDNTVVYFPSKKLLFGGCMIIAGDKLGNTADADLKKWPESVKKLKDLDFNILVPGHGLRFDRSLIDNTISLLETP